MDYEAFFLPRTMRLLDRLAFQVNGVANSLTPDAVHDLRVAIRRFTQALTSGKPCFPSRTAKKIRRRTKALMSLAGAVRDCDIALKLVSRSKAPDAATVEAKLHSRRADAQEILGAFLRQWTSEKCVSKWRRALEAGAVIAGAQPVTVEAVAHHQLPRLAEAFFREGDRGASRQASAEQLHRFRLAAKKFRYTLELFTEFYRPATAHWMEQLMATQTLLGGISDCAVTRRLVQDLGASAAIIVALKGRQKRKTQEFRKAWEEGLGAPRRRKQWVQALHHPPRKPMTHAVAKGQLLLQHLG
jgi:CHAD domain-containing protein